MSTEIQFANNNNNESFSDDECIEFDIESIIDGFYDYVDDINSIRCVDDIMENLHEYLEPLGFDRDLNVCNVLSFDDIDDLDDLDDNLNAPYYDDEAMDLKIETINSCIRLMLE